MRKKTGFLTNLVLFILPKSYVVIKKSKKNALFNHKIKYTRYAEASTKRCSVKIAVPKL